MGIWLRRLVIYGPLTVVGLFVIGLIAGMLTLPDSTSLERLLQSDDMATRAKASSALVALRGGDRTSAMAQLQALVGSAALTADEQENVRKTLKQLEPGEKEYRKPQSGWRADAAKIWYRLMEETAGARMTVADKAENLADWISDRWKEGLRGIRKKWGEWTA